MYVNYILLFQLTHHTLPPFHSNLSFQDPFYDTESSGKDNLNEDNHVRYEDDFDEEDGAKSKRIHDEEVVNDKIKMSEVPAPIVTNDEAGVGSTVIGANGTVSEQDISPVS